jgi:hypothetical protein
MGTSLMWTGAITEGLAHYDQAIALYDPANHRPLVTRFNYDSRASVLAYRSLALWLLGYPEAALADADQALHNAREIGHPATLMVAPSVTSMTLILCGKHASANERAAEAAPLATKGLLTLEGVRDDVSKLRSGLDRQRLESGPSDKLRDRRMAGNRVNGGSDFPSALLGTRPC